MENKIYHLLRLPAYIFEGLAYHFAGSLFTAKPRMIQFPVCDRCNAKCIMCNRWQNKHDIEISIDKIREVFMRPLFSQVEDVSLHGGEPTLRKDLDEICAIIQKACPKLKRLWISTNGFGPTRIEKRILEIINILDFNRISSLDINVSIDGLEETHDKIRGVKGGFRQSIETIKVLIALSEHYPIKISMGTVIQPLNLHQLGDLENLAAGFDIPLQLQPLMFDKFFNIAGNEHLKFSKEDIKEFRQLIERKFSNGSSTTNYYWCDFLSIMSGANRKIPCAFDRYVFSLYPTGEVLPCSREDWIVFGNVYDQPADKIWYGSQSKQIRSKMKKEVCPSCSFYCGAEFSLQKEFFSYAMFLLKKHIFPNL